ncbi:hypothetical protein Scep_007623 [Stephania cephalantha]|uniref:DUF4283 domain-containing protein n=1 Tax=Stephania cephalantha TaxID=152367 RepID=A0AAP0KA87_9MAGN
MATAKGLGKPTPPVLSEEEDISTKKVKNQQEDDHDEKMDEGFNDSFKGALTNVETITEDDAFYATDIEVGSDEYVRVKDPNDGNNVSFSFVDSVQDRMNNHLKRALMVKVLGRTIGFKTLYNRMLVLWKSTGAMKVMDVDNGYYMVRFALIKDYMTVLLGGLKARYYHKRILRVVAETFREFIKIDYNNTIAQRAAQRRALSKETEASTSIPPAPADVTGPCIHATKKGRRNLAKSLDMEGRGYRNNEIPTALSSRFDVLWEVNDVEENDYAIMMEGPTYPREIRMLTVGGVLENFDAC